ncbi:M23 family metallopeptidase [Sphingobacterium hungaricum]
MRTLHTFIFFFICSVCATNAQELNIYTEQAQKGYSVYVDNDAIYPQSLLLQFKLTNLAFDNDNYSIFVLPAKTKRYKIGNLTVQNPRLKNSFSYTTKTTKGDVLLDVKTNAVVYDLPYKKGNSFKVSQGYNGNLSHKNEFALDFTMPIGTEILAAREGTVIEVVQHNTKSCPQEECKKFNNYITVLHNDGSFASYVHINYNGARCKVGEVINRGDVIALSGNTGWSSGPHLHFVCFFGGFDAVRSFETKFKLNDGSLVSVLDEGKSYLRDY